MPDWDNQLPHDAPKRSCVKGAIEYMEAQNIPHSREDVFRFNAVSYRQGWALDQRGAKIEGIIIQGRVRGEAGSLFWAQKTSETLTELSKKKGLRLEHWRGKLGLKWVEILLREHLVRSNTASALPVQRAGWIDHLRRRKKEFAEAMKMCFPTPNSWKVVKFSDEVYFALRPQGHMYIIRKPGERYCADCIQHQDKPTLEEKRYEQNPRLGRSTTQLQIASGLLQY
jgi:hypothetical protein